MDSRAVTYTYDRPTPVHDAVTTSGAVYTYDRPTPVHRATVSIGYTYIYDRPTPLYDSNHDAAVFTYDTGTTSDPTQLKIWDGTQWVRKPLYRWDGSNWTQVT